MGIWSWHAWAASIAVEAGQKGQQAIAAGVDRHGQQLLGLQHIALPLGDKQKIPEDAPTFVRVNVDFLA